MLTAVAAHFAGYRIYLLQKTNVDTEHKHHHIKKTNPATYSLCSLGCQVVKLILSILSSSETTGLSEPAGRYIS